MKHRKIVRAVLIGGIVLFCLVGIGLRAQQDKYPESARWARVL